MDLGDADGKRKVEELLDGQKARAIEVLEQNRDVVEALRDALLERDELIGEEIVAEIHTALAKRN